VNAHHETTRALVRSAFVLAHASSEELPLAAATFRLAQEQARTLRSLETGLTLSLRIAKGEPANDAPDYERADEQPEPESYADEDARHASYRHNDDEGDDHDDA